MNIKPATKTLADYLPIGGSQVTSTAANKGQHKPVLATATSKHSSLDGGRYTIHVNDKRLINEFSQFLLEKEKLAKRREIDKIYPRTHHRCVDCNTDTTLRVYRRDRKRPEDMWYVVEGLDRHGNKLYRCENCYRKKQRYERHGYKEPQITNNVILSTKPNKSKKNVKRASSSGGTGSGQKATKAKKK